VLHLPLAYGWSTIPGLAYRVGQTLPFGRAALLALGVLAVSLPLALLAKRHVSPLKKRLLSRAAGPKPGPMGAPRASPLPTADARP
jgi:acyltransferase